MNQTPNSFFRCDICGKKGAKIRVTSRSYGAGAGLLIIENVPIISCYCCGKSYLTAETIHRIEQIKRNRQSLTKPRSVPVAVFACSDKFGPGELVE